MRRLRGLRGLGRHGRGRAQRADDRAACHQQGQAGDPQAAHLLVVVAAGQAEQRDHGQHQPSQQQGKADAQAAQGDEASRVGRQQRFALAALLAEKGKAGQRGRAS